MGRGSNNRKEYLTRRIWVYRQLQWESILQQEVDEDSDAMVVLIKDDAEVDTYSPSDDTKVKTRLFRDELGICNTKRTKDARYISINHFRHATNAKMLFLW
jgi:hypothetical protein